MPRFRPNLEGTGTLLLLVVVVGVALAVGLSFAMNAASDDLRQEVRLASSLPVEHPRSVWAGWISAGMTRDLAPADYTARFLRAEDLDHRADRIRELAGAGSLAGVLLMLVTATPEARLDRKRAEASPLANTRSNGTV